MPDPDMRIQELHRLLGDIGNALVSGQFDSLPAMSATQERLLAWLDSGALGRRRISLAQMHALKLRANRNERLLQAAIRGMKSAAQRRAEVASALRSCRAYDREGRPVKIDSQEPAVEIRR